MAPARRAVRHRRLMGRFTESMLETATQAQLAAAKALMAVGTLLVISKVAMHSSSEAMSPMGAISWEADSEGSGL